MTFGARVSQPGYDATTAAVKDLTFDSDANSLKIWKAGSVNISVSEANGGAGTGYVEVSHGLDYPPFFLTYFKLKDANKIWFQKSLDDSQLPATYINTTSYANNTNLVMEITVNGTLGAFTAIGYYIIFIDEAYQT